MTERIAMNNNLTSLRNKKKVFSEKHRVPNDQLENVLGHKLLKKIGHSQEEMHAFLTSTTDSIKPS